jgi:radical SAM superfamily enzyme YgiQ (UPF0313 family)
LQLLEDAAGQQGQNFDTWTSRARRRFPEHLAGLRSWGLYGRIDRYRRCVTDVNHLLEWQGRQAGLSQGLADYEDPRYSPLHSEDLRRAAREHESNPFYPWFSGRLTALMEQKRPAVAGISLNYRSQALCAFALVGFLRRHFPRIVIVLGGGLVTSWLKRSGGQNPFPGLVDHCVSGPGEAFLLRLIGIDGEGDRFYRPDYRDFPVADYLAPGSVLPYSASVGCSWRRCTFCPEKAEGSCYRPVPERQVREDLEALVSTMQPALVHFLDSTMSLPLLEYLVEYPPGAPWYGFARVTSRLADRNFCRALKASGCAMLKLGVESGDQGVLDALAKGIRVDKASQALHALKEAGIGTYVYLLFGTPAETPDAARRTLKFTAEHHQVIDFLNLAIFNLPMGSEEAAALQVHPFYEGDLSLYADFDHPAGWGRKQVRVFLDREFRRQPDVASILRRQPPFFTSNHAPFLLKSR